MRKQLIGICIGSQGSVIGTLKDKVVDVILSETSNREVPTVVSFGDRERNFGDASVSTGKKNFKRTILYPNRWLGIQKDWPFIAEETKYSNIKPTIDKTNKVGFDIVYKGQKDFYSAESLMGLYFTKLKKNWLRDGIDTKEVVVSVPDYYTSHERKAMLEALEIADLQCTALVNESSAISLAYGLLRLRDFDDTKPRTVAFVDMGHAKTTIFFGTFTKKKMKVVTSVSERFCGAREFDYIIAEHVSKQFEAKYGENPMTAPKCKLRLMDAVAKIRKMLTVNKDGTISVDSLMDGEDLDYHLTKDEFESLIQPVITKFEALCKRALKKAKEEGKIDINDLHSVEMVGDAVRTPIIQKVIKDVFGKDISKTLIPDECISRGCALYAAMISPFYTIMNFEFEHYNPYGIVMEYPYLTKDKKVENRTHMILKAGENFPAKKSITFTNTQTPQQEVIPLKFKYDGKELEWMNDLYLRNYNVTMPLKYEEKWKFTLTFELDINGLPMLSHAVVSEEYYEEVPVKETPKKEEAPVKKEENKTEEPKKEEQQPPKQEEQQQQQPPKQEEQQQQPPKQEEQQPPKKEEPPKTQKVKRERNNKCPINISESHFGTPQAILNQYLQREVSQETDDKTFIIASNKKNELEQYIYNTREKFNNALKPHVLPAEKDQLSKHMDTLLDWLYSGDEDIFNKAVLESKGKDMLTLGNTIYSRMMNWNQLEENITLLEKAIDKVIQATKVEREKLPDKKTYLTEDDFKLINEHIQASRNKVNEFKQKYGEGVKTAEPLIAPNVVSNEQEELKKKVTKVYQDAEFKVKEEERKRKEEEERKKKEEEEKKKKEEEEKKKKEEEEKKKKEGEKKEDVEMKDETQQGKTEEKKEEAQEKKDPDAMDVE